MKRVLAIGLALLLLCGALPMSALAAPAVEGTMVMDFDEIPGTIRVGDTFTFYFTVSATVDQNLIEAYFLYDTEYFEILPGAEELVGKFVPDPTINDATIIARRSSAILEMPTLGYETYEAIGAYWDYDRKDTRSPAGDDIRFLKITATAIKEGATEFIFEEFSSSIVYTVGNNDYNFLFPYGYDFEEWTHYPLEILPAQAVEVLDYTPIQEAIDACPADLSGYRSSTVQDLEDAIAIGEAMLLAQDAADQDEITAIAGAIDAAVLALEDLADMTPAQEAKADAPIEGKTQASIDDFNDYADGILAELEANDDRSEADVETAALAIVEAYSMLIEAGPEAGTILSAGLYELENYVSSSDYTVSGTLLTTIGISDTFAVVIQVAGDVSDKLNYRLYNENGGKIEANGGYIDGRRASYRAVYDEGTDITTITYVTSLGSAGTRTLEVYDDGVETGVYAGTVTVPAPAPGFVSASFSDEEIVAGGTTTLTVITNTLPLSSPKLLTESGSNCLGAATSKVKNNDGQWVYTYTITILTKGERVFSLYTGTTQLMDLSISVVAPTPVFVSASFSDEQIEANGSTTLTVITENAPLDSPKLLNENGSNFLGAATNKGKNAEGQWMYTYTITIPSNGERVFELYTGTTKLTELNITVGTTD